MSTVTESADRVQKPACENCRFYQAAAPDAAHQCGFCRKNPPLADGYERMFPTTYPEQWCGEYQSSKGTSEQVALAMVQTFANDLREAGHALHHAAEHLKNIAGKGHQASVTRQAGTKALAIAEGIMPGE